MNVEFNEFTYAFALLDSLQMTFSTPGKRLLPILPTTRAEATLGYDARLDTTLCSPLFLQFKVCERMLRRSAIGRDVLTPPFYRFKIWPGKKSNQHEALLALNQTEPFVYYVAPRFHETEFLAYAHTSGKLPGYSVWVEPSAIGPHPLDDKQHYVVYTADGSEAYFCSEPQKIQAFPEPPFLGAIFQRKPMMPEEHFVRIRRLIRDLQEVPDDIQVATLNYGDPFESFIDNPDRPMIQRLEWMVRHYFGCATVLLFDDQEAQRS